MLELADVDTSSPDAGQPIFRIAQHHPHKYVDKWIRFFDHSKGLLCMLSPCVVVHKAYTIRHGYISYKKRKYSKLLNR